MAIAIVLQNLPAMGLRKGDTIQVTPHALNTGSTNADGSKCDIYKYSKPVFAPVNGGVTVPGSRFLCTGNHIQITEA